MGGIGRYLCAKLLTFSSTTVGPGKTGEKRPRALAMLRILFEDILPEVVN